MPPQQGQSSLPQVAAALKGRLRFIPASRGNALTPSIGQNIDRLASDAANMVGVLDHLQRNRSRFDRFIKLVSDVIPEIRQLSVRINAPNIGDIAVWEHDPLTERGDLAPSLSHSGAGIRHVLALLLLAFYEPVPLVILTDELENSLHPGAVRELMDIFETTFHQHQFVIATHSPTAITSGRPATISVVKKEAGQSTVQSIDGAELQHRRELLAEIGASVSDLFGADAVLWVEGTTEEICFPRIWEKLSTRPLGTAVIRGLISTSDLEARDAERVLEIYEKLSGADALLPPAIGFILDDESRSDQKKKELIHRSNNRLRFIPRRMYENYLLHPAAIAAILSAPGSEGSLRRSTGEEDVAKWLEANHTNKKYGGGWPSSVEWRTMIHAGKLLKDLFWDLSGQRVTYRKPEHSVAITEWLLANDPETLREVADLLRDSMQR